MAVVGATRWIVRQIIPDLYTTFKSASRALEWLKAAGYGYRRTDFLRDWRESLGFEAKKEVIKYIPKKYRPSEATITDTSYDLRTKYQYIGEIEYIERETGQLITREVSFPTDELVSIFEAEEHFGEIMEEVAEEYEVERAIGQRITGVKRKTV